VVCRPAITDERELGALMLSIDEYTGWPTLKAAMQFRALTMTRPGEVRLMRRSEDPMAQSDVAHPRGTNEDASAA